MFHAMKLEYKSPALEQKSQRAMPCCGISLLYTVKVFSLV